MSGSPNVTRVPPSARGARRQADSGKRARKDGSGASGWALRAMVQNAQDPIGLLALDGSLIEANPAWCVRLGRPGGSLAGRPLSEVTWWSGGAADLQRLQAAFAEAADGQPARFEVEDRSAGGGGRVFSCSFQPVVNEGGVVGAVLLEGRDLTDRRLAEDGLRLLQRITIAVGEAASLEQALQVVLAEVCSTTHWALGQAWLPAAGQQRLIQASACWYDRPELERFCVESAEADIGPGRGLIGFVHSSRRPMWIGDVAEDDRFLRAEAAQRAGLKSALILPVLAGDVVVALLEFYLRERRGEDERLVALVSLVAGQLGSAIRHKQDAIERERLLHQAETAETRLRTLLDCAPDAIVVSAADGAVALVNREAERLFGQPRQELVGQPLRALLSADPLASADLDHLDAPATAGLSLSLTARTRDGREVPVEVSVSPVRAGDQLLLTSVIRDTSMQRSLERQKDEFFANISHDLRTPLAAIKASIGVVLANEPPATPLPIHRMFVNIDQAAERLVVLVSDLLELTRLQAGRAQLQPDRLDLRSLARRVAASIQPSVDERSQRLELSLPRSPIWAIVDGGRVEQALGRLLSNAHRHGRDGGLIRLGLSRRNGRALFSVADDGPGIAQPEQRRIFERYYRAEVESALRNQGSGLGLPIARAMIELQGGRVWVDSSIGSGSTFWIELPLRGQAGEEAIG